MDFIDEIRLLAARIPKQLDRIKTEEATKIAFIMPFVRALGYDTTDPTEVIPEFTADIGTKKGEKVDYAIAKGGAPVILMECKWSGADLDREDASQLYRYFATAKARFAILTNGIIYRFYTDLEQPNVMDSKPFFEFNMLDIKEPLVEELKRFTKTSFDLDNILTIASDLKYTNEIKRILAEQLSDPSDDFVRFLGRQVYDGVMTKTVREQFAQVTKRAFQQFVSDRIDRILERRKSEVLGEETASSEASAQDEKGLEEPQKDRGVVTTEEEIEGYYIVKAILREVIDPKRVAIRDRLSYCGILLDNNQLKPICRLWFNSSQKYLGLFDEQKKEQRVPIEDLNDIYRHADRLKARVALYESAEVSEAVT